MRLLMQRVSSARVDVDGKTVGQIGKGILAFLGIHKADEMQKTEWLAQKLVNLRIFSDEQGKMNLSLLDIQGEVLIVSQFTLYGQCAQGRRPDFFEAAHPDVAIKLYERFIADVKSLGPKVETGIFGALMQVHLVNDGPVTFLLES